MNAQSTHAIAALDLEPIKVKLMHEESGEGWTLERANAVEFEYRRFLFLMKKYPHEQTAPLVDVDTFWHYHILDTVKYHADCDAVFGHYLHHFPYIGLRGEDDEAAHIRVGQRMKELYEDTFGEDYVRASVAAFAHSGVLVEDIAHSGVLAANVAHSGVLAGDIAHSGVLAADVAHSGVLASDIAHSGVLNTSVVAAEAAIVAAQQSSFYSLRPRLSQPL
ncbi:glycine-rich domain-containing protein-like [Duganella dendranthematis]|jgi:hypothetical protein|uniref:Glycine-rich domain-containing protein-like n=1 Tax=Duganella dendranthematis TaxID=2728021 RepID=A0ABX6MCR9_9BURK|nr:glycine-rich domain-containing protein-like [Duganella dendranthematis]QJD91908.1 glycine-rich domain-containing protein-like [Duganella dendranthematis]